MLSRSVCALVLATGIASPAFAQGLVDYEVSPALAETWSKSLDATPGQAIDIRVRISYTGTLSPIGLASMFFQPSISNWDAGGPSTDTLLPFRNVGGALTTPMGQVSDSPGVYGRITPFGDRAVSATSFYKGHVNTVGPTTFLRIAQAQVTSWIGGAGNTSGGSGMVVGQAPYSIVTGNPAYPPFDSQLQNVIVLKLGIVLSADTDFRTLTVNAAEAFANQPYNLNTTLKWWGDISEKFLGSVQGNPNHVPATINVVPAPASLALLGLAAMTGRRRRK